MCISQQDSGMQYTYPMVNTWSKTNYIDAKDCKRMICHKDITKRDTRNQAIKRYQLKKAINGYQLNQLDQRSYEPQE